ncbi:MAG: acetoacetate decarboxylase family protein [Deltaproteobacteria bacterium]|nr:acetoacetate decarboxylase family protein [Deltaproteobacteria bacterium]
MDNQAVLNAPAPWGLMGSGYIILLKLQHDFVEGSCFVQSPLKDSFAGGFGTVMYVDYSYSDVGPYQELLFIPGRFDVAAGRYFSITKIFVSTQDSVVNGQNNWGIPKELATFACEEKDPSTHYIRITREGTTAAEFTFRSFPVRMPVTTGIVPRCWRTLAHVYEGRTYLTTPMARGCISPARLVDFVANRSFLPEFNRSSIIAVFKVPQFFMVFPKARILSG